MIDLHVTERQLELLTEALDYTYHAGELYGTRQEFEELYDKLVALASEHSDGGE